ncbi:hypothetical protein HYV82_01725 [Candidatus Woesearchaeota archaeon]|nr:hypothetical protein [Candidatus Woesearchaeota archaeon]
MINMGNMTLSIPNNVHEEMRLFPEVRWSEVARKAIIEKIEAMKLAEKLAQKSRLTQRDVEDFNRKIRTLAHEDSSGFKLLKNCFS